MEDTKQQPQEQDVGEKTNIRIGYVIFLSINWYSKLGKGLYKITELGTEKKQTNLELLKLSIMECISS